MTRRQLFKLLAAAPCAGLLPAPAKATLTNLVSPASPTSTVWTDGRVRVFMLQRVVSVDDLIASEKPFDAFRAVVDELRSACADLGWQEPYMLAFRYRSEPRWYIQAFPCPQEPANQAHP
jgi:hypothetical protein